MSGQPYRYSSDVERYRNEYMSNLADRSSLDDKVLQAVRTYISNGTLPAVSQMPDTRTTSEKLLDFIGLKNDIVSEFSIIMEKPVAEALIQGLTQSPLNVDNKLLIFVAQRAPEIASTLRKNYKYKIKGDTNDIYTFVEFVNKLYADKNNSTASIKSLMDSGYNKDSGIINGSELELFWKELERIFFTSLAGIKRYTVDIINDTRRKINALREWLPNDVEFNRFISNALNPEHDLDSPESRTIVELSKWMTTTLPNKQILRSLANQLKNYIIDSERNNRLPDKTLVIEYIKRINDLIPEIPSIMKSGTKVVLPPSEGGSFMEDISKLSSTIDEIKNNFAEFINTIVEEVRSKNAVKNRQSISDIKNLKSEMDIIQKLFKNDIIPLHLPTEKKNDILKRYDSLLTTLNQVVSESEKKSPILKKLENGLIILNDKITDFLLLMGEIVNEFTHQSVNQELEPETSVQKKPLDIHEFMSAKETSQSSEQKTMTDKEREIYKSKEFIDTFNNMKEDIPIFMRTENEDEFKKLRISIEQDYKTLNDILKDSGISEVEIDFLNLTKLEKEALRSIIFSPEEGEKSGVGLRRRRGRPKGSGIVRIPIEQKINKSSGIEPTYKFTPFGKYIINNDRLRDNVISIKTLKGTNVIGMPSTKVSQRFGKVVKNIIGGKLPSFDDMNGLSSEEKLYLHKIATKANIVDKLNIPTPSKDQEEKDLHQFEVMKGEIMAGNDSNDMVKKFKSLILKLSKNGTLPKQQVNDILSDMLDLGY